MAKRKFHAPPQPIYPAVSVIIPLYNAEKYIGECLDSILAQTFKDYEVIVVDDCSTDSSCAIIESYRKKFGGRLKLVHTRKNSGSGTEPRNMGLSLSRGEYVYFMDNDDVIMPKGLEELYALAKEYDADVVQCEKNYDVPTEILHDPEQLKKIKPSCWPSGEKIFITKPTLLDEDLAKRATDFARKWLTWSIWLQLIRRDFVIENQLRFVGVVMDDMLFTICEICSAKKYLVVPNVIYMHRARPGSFMWRDSENVEKFLTSRLISLKDGVRYLDNFLNDFEPFSSRPDLRYMLFNMFTKDLIEHLMPIYSQVPPFALDKILRKELSEGDNIAFNSFIFNMLNIYHLQMYKNQQQFQQFATQAQQRMAELESELKRKEL